MESLLFTLHPLLVAGFWACVLLIAHSYALYPKLLSRLARGRRLPADRFETDAELPEVAVLMAVYNEEDVLQATLASIVASDYPEEKLRVYVGSDGSTDGSDEIAGRFQAAVPGLVLRVFGGRNGKVRIVNRLAEEARGNFRDPDSAVLVLCDANVRWTPPMLRRLARHFKRPEVGLVGASVTDPAASRDGIGDEEEAYVDRENRTKFHEGVLWGNTMGAFGACYALRAGLFRAVPEHFIVDDFYLTMACLEQGRRAIVDLDARCHESVSTDIREEFRRKRRIATGNFQNWWRYRRLFHPWRGGLANCFAFWSHKGLRWLGPLLIAGAVVSCAGLAVVDPLYRWALAGFAGTFAVAGIDHWLSGREGAPHVKLFRFVRYFYAMNAAIALGLVAFLRGARNSVWEPTRRVAPATRVDHAAPAPGRAASGRRAHSRDPRFDPTSVE